MFNKRADTREDRRQLLDRARREREERQSTNVRLAAASVIQRAYRLHSTRLRLAKAVRVAFDVSVRQPTVDWCGLIRRVLYFSRSPRHGDDVRLLALLGRIEKSIDTSSDQINALDMSAVTLRRSFQSHFFAHWCSSMLINDVSVEFSGLSALRAMSCLIETSLKLLHLQSWSGLPSEKWAQGESIILRFLSITADPLKWKLPSPIVHTANPSFRLLQSTIFQSSTHLNRIHSILTRMTNSLSANDENSLRVRITALVLFTTKLMFWREHADSSKFLHLGNCLDSDQLLLIGISHFWTLDLRSCCNISHVAEMFFPSDDLTHNRIMGVLANALDMFGESFPQYLDSIQPEKDKNNNGHAVAHLFLNFLDFVLRKKSDQLTSRSSELISIVFRKMILVCPDAALRKIEHSSSIDSVRSQIQLMMQRFLDSGVIAAMFKAIICNEDVHASSVWDGYFACTVQKSSHDAVFSDFQDIGLRGENELIGLVTCRLQNPQFCSQLCSFYGFLTTVISRVTAFRLSVLNSLYFGTPFLQVTWIFMLSSLGKRFDFAQQLNTQKKSNVPPPSQSSSSPDRSNQSVWDSFFDLFREKSNEAQYTQLGSQVELYDFSESNTAQHSDSFESLNQSCLFLQSKSLNWLLVSGWPISASSAADSFNHQIPWGGMCDILYSALSIYSHSLIIADDEDFQAQQRPLPFSMLASFTQALVFVTFHLAWNSNKISVWTGLGCSTVDLMSMCSRLLRELYQRDLRHRFVPANGWLLPSSYVELWHAEFESDSVRAHWILQNLPFLLPFATRVDLFSRWTKQRITMQRQQIGETRIVIRRSHVLEDGYSAVKRLGDRFNGTLKVSFVSDQMVPEDGIDLGGPYKEFLEIMVRQLFQNNFGLFAFTSQQLMYPSDHKLLPEFDELMEFSGKLIGKALTEGILVDAQFATFFLNKLVDRPSSFSDLSSLDPELHKNLLFIKRYDGDISDLALSFSLTDENFGHKQEIELRPNGSQIEVTSANYSQYIYLVADYHLNHKIAHATSVFRRGLKSQLDQKWLSIFDSNELQRLISGSDQPIDIDDWQQHTQYDQRTDASCSATHRVVKWFWKAVRLLSPEQRRKLLRFVTAVDRPPLNGFSQLNPPFTIRLVPFQESQSERSLWDRFADFVKSSDVPKQGTLPTAATCFNMLKLPLFPDFDVLQEKLAVAIENNTGFGLA